MTEMALKMSAGAAVMDAPSTENGMDCCADETGARAGCVATCAGAIAVLCELAPMPIAVTMLDQTANVEWPFFGRAIPPEPHPPKPAVLI